MSTDGTFAWIGALGVVYLLFLARSAWKQGQIRQFGFALLFVALLLGALVLVSSAVIWLDTH